MKHRGNGRTSEGVVAATPGGYRCARQPNDTYAQVARKDCWRRQSGGQHPDGILVQVWCDDQDHGSQRGRGRSVTCCCIGCLRKTVVRSFVGSIHGRIFQAKTYVRQHKDTRTLIIAQGTRPSSRHHSSFGGVEQELERISVRVKGLAACVY